MKKYDVVDTVVTQLLERKEVSQTIGGDEGVSYYEGAEDMGAYILGSVFEASVTDMKELLMTDKGETKADVMRRFGERFRI